MMRTVVYGVLAIAVIGVLVFALRPFAGGGDAGNYDLQYSVAPGYLEVKGGPSTIFKFERKGNPDLVIRAGAVRAMEERKVDPSHTSQSYAESILRTTIGGQGWSAKHIGTVQADGGEFFLLDRRGPDRRVITACLVKGNTTFVISMLGLGDAAALLDEEMETFVRCLEGLKIRPS